MENSDMFSNQKIDQHMDKVKGSKPDKQSELLMNLNDSSKRLKVLEDRYLTIRKKTQLTDQNMLEANKRFNSEIKAINDELIKLKISMKEMNEKLDQLVSETSGLAKRQDLITLSKYVDFWRPMNFITREQLENEIKHLRK